MYCLLMMFSINVLIVYVCVCVCVYLLSILSVLVWNSSHVVAMVTVLILYLVISNL